MLQLLHRLVWRGAFGLLGRVMPLRAAWVLAGPLSKLARIVGLRRNVALTNLRMAFPERTDREIEGLADAAARNALTVFLELPVLRHLNTDELMSAMRITNPELLRNVGDRGALFLSGHCGNWEIFALSAALYGGAPFTILVKEQKDFGELARMRRLHGNTVVTIDRGARVTSAVLARGGVVALIPDQSAPAGDHLVPLFGIPTWTYSAPARLALRYRPKVLVGFAVRVAPGRYEAEMRELPHHDLADDEAGAIEFTRRYVAMLEEVVRAHPEQWLWHHKKWKNTEGVHYA